MNRSDYMSGPSDFATHRAYYAQMVTEEVKLCVLATLGKERILHTRTDHMNEIPLREWDRAAAMCRATVLESMHQFGDRYSMAGAVCVVKEAARQIREAEDV